MDIFEAIRVFYTPRIMTWSHFLSPREKQQYEAAWQQRQEAEKVCECPETYIPFTAREGRAVALAAIELVDVGVEERYQYLPHIILKNLAQAVPGALQGLYPRLIERNLFWGDGVLYREADAGTRDLLLDFLENEVQGDLEYQDVLCALAWIGDEKVQARFHAWRQGPPTWHAIGGYSMQEYARCAGWEFSREGKRRDLCFQTSYDLISVDAAPASNARGPVAVIASREDRCPWCGRPLVTLFDVRVRDRRLAFLELGGKRLRIPICINCSLQNRVYFDVERDGSSRWGESNGNPPHLLRRYEDDLMPPWPELRLVLGKKRKTPYVNNGSHLGGYPAWVQSPEYPQCPSCQQTMRFIGQLEPAADIGAPSSIEGIVYAFLCATCGKATTGYQQT